MLNRITAKFCQISNLIEISLVGRAPGKPWGADCKKIDSYSVNTLYQWDRSHQHHWLTILACWQKINWWYRQQKCHHLKDFFLNQWLQLSKWQFPLQPVNTNYVKMVSFSFQCIIDCSHVCFIWTGLQNSYKLLSVWLVISTIRLC